jgi:hypothetical protein
MTKLIRLWLNCAIAFPLMLWIGSADTDARCLVQPPSLALQSGFVFMGKVLSIEDPTLPAPQLHRPVYALERTVKVRFMVEQVLRGVYVPEITIGTKIGGYESGYQFEVGQRYLVYAHETKDGLVVPGCSRTRPTANAKEDLSLIWGQNQSQSLKPEELSNLVQRQVGSKIKPALGVISEPTYVISDFNGDGLSDVAIVVIVEQGRDELKRRGVRYIDINPFSRTNGAELDPSDNDKMSQNCLGIAFLHGSSKELDPQSISDKFIIYDCFSSIRRVPKGVPIRRGRRSTGPPPQPKGDSILLDLESGAQALVYWNGKTYRGFSIRPGD